jgi:predicted transposase YbfD/YdcC
MGMVESERHIGSEVTIDCRYYISSLPADAKQLATSVRAHWGVEFAVVRHIALNLLKKERSFKGGLRAKRLKAGWDQDYLLKLLGVG